METQQRQRWTTYVRRYAWITLLCLTPIALAPSLFCRVAILSDGSLLVPLGFAGLMMSRTVDAMKGMGRVRLLLGACVLVNCGGSCSGGMAAGLVRSVHDGSVPRLVLTRLVDRAAPLVAAIQAYESKHGEPPPSLDALVPEFIPSIPETGLPWNPSFHYSVGGNGHCRLRPSLRNPQVSAWGLGISQHGHSLFETECFGYLKPGFGQPRWPIVRIADWAVWDAYSG